MTHDSIRPPNTADLPADVPAVLDLLADTHPTIALAVVRALGDAHSPALRATEKRLLALANDSRLTRKSMPS
jgi:hypothetical protein